MKNSPTARELLFYAYAQDSFPKPLRQKMTLQIGVKALARLGKELIGLPANATCIPVEKQHEFFFAYTIYSPYHEALVPVNRFAEAISARLHNGAARFHSLVSNTKWNNAILPSGFSRVHLSIELIPQNQ